MGWQKIHLNYVGLGLQDTSSSCFSMPGYIKKALKQFQHKLHKHQQQLFATVPIKYGTKKQYATQESKAPLLDEKGKKFIQHVCGDSFSLAEQ